MSPSARAYARSPRGSDTAGAGIRRPASWCLTADPGPAASSPVDEGAQQADSWCIVTSSPLLAREANRRFLGDVTRFAPLNLNDHLFQLAGKRERPNVVI